MIENRWKKKQSLSERVVAGCSWDIQNLSKFLYYSILGRDANMHIVLEMLQKELRMRDQVSYELWHAPKEQKSLGGITWIIIFE